MLAQVDCFRLPLSSQSVHCVVTSPPYWGLRKYAGEQGAEPLGLEPTPERHIERTVQWAREVWRVLRDDGVFWLNYGDCYASGEIGRHDKNAGGDFDRPGWDGIERDNGGNRNPAGAGNLMMMPHRVALALQADGWIVRQDLVWSKPNPMPESANGWRWQRERTASKPIRDRTKGKIADNSDRNDADGGRFGNSSWNEYEYGPDYELRRGSWRHTRAHEYVFMLTKQMQYWSDQEAVREALATEPHAPGNTPVFGDVQRNDFGTARMSAIWGNRSGRNPRSVLHIPTSPYKGAHYATFPPALIAPLILATCPRWCCPVCGQGWAPVVEKHGGRGHDWNADNREGKDRAIGGRYASESMPDNYAVNVLGHRPTCDHPHTQAEAVPGIVCDPFVGSGTTVMVAKELLRRGIGFDISRPYLVEQAVLRTGGSAPLDTADLPLWADLK